MGRAVKDKQTIFYFQPNPQGTTSILPIMLIHGKLFQDRGIYILHLIHVLMKCLLGVSRAGCLRIISMIKSRSGVMRKPTFCICKNKGADQLRSDCEADQRLCFHYMDSTIPLLYFQPLAIFHACTA